MLEEELLEIQYRNNADKNLRNSLFSIGLWVLSRVVFFIILDSFHPGHNKFSRFMLIGFFYGLKVLAAVLAIIVLKNIIPDMKAYKSNKNYISLAISIIVLIILANQLCQLF